MENTLQTKKTLDEVVVIRLVLIVLLVLYHSFCMYSGAWKPLDGMPDIKAYWWIDKVSYSFMLESFVLISGYLFAFQYEKGKIRNIKSLVISKTQRLLVPSIIFSVIYLLLFKPEISRFGVVYDIINGIGHMWFLPMLFWCFIMTYYFNKIKIKEELKLVGLFVFAMLPSLPIPLRIGTSLHYLFFFYLGGYLWYCRESLIKARNIYIYIY